MLFRLSLHGNELVAGRGQPGRGAWVCRGSRRCFDLAIERRAFVRALHHEPVVVGHHDALWRELEAGNAPGQGVGG